MQHGLNLGCKTKDQGIPVYEELTHPKLRARTSQPNEAQETNPLIDAEIASVSQTYDTQEKLEVVLQKGTEATLQVRYDNRHLANSNLLHGIPELSFLTTLPTGDASPTEDWNQRTSPTMKTPQDEATCKKTSVKNSQYKTQEALNSNFEDDLLKIPGLNYKGRRYEELPPPLIYDPQGAANEEKCLTTSTTNQQLLNI